MFDVAGPLLLAFSLFIINFWYGLSLVGTESMYRQCLDTVNPTILAQGHGFFPQSVRTAIHELQDRLGERRTDFRASV